jgi:hypothetical protein
MDNKFYQWTAIVIVGVIAVISLFSTHIPKSGVAGFGATSAGNLLAENYIPYVLYNGGYNSAKDLNITGGITFGTSGTTFNKIITGTGALIVPSGAGATVNASSTKAFDMAVSGVVSGDTVIVQFATSTALSGVLYGAGNLGGPFTIVGAAASTTSGFITVVVGNLSSANTSISASGIASSTNYEIIK